MFMHQLLKPNNIKLHFQIETACLSALKVFLLGCELVTKQKPSFCVLKYNSLIFTCFYSGHINVTGIKTLENICQCVESFASKTNIPLQSFSAPVVDNISAKYETKKQKINLNILKSSLVKDSRIISLKYNRERFPGLFIKTLMGTVIWFPTNSIISVGSKNTSDLSFLDNLIKQYE